MFRYSRKWRCLSLACCVAFATGCGTDSGCDGGLEGILPGVVGGIDGNNGGSGIEGGGGGAEGSGEEEGGGGIEVAPSQSLKPYRNDIDADEAFHLLRRAAFGATPQRVEEVVGMGLEAAVEDLLAYKPVPDAVTDLADSFDPTIDKSWLIHILEGPNPLHERMAMFWHDRFATSRKAVFTYLDFPLIGQHWQMLRANALGNYRDFLQALTLDPLMLLWLDGGDSPKDNPNENYTREFWELFTLGRDVLYTEEDIKEGARGFTGTMLLRTGNDPQRPVFDIINHDQTLKSVFPGRAEPANYDYLSMINLTLAQPEASEYVARNLFVFFVHDHPSDDTIQELADLFVEGDFAIEPLVRTLLKSEAFFSDEAKGNQVTTPVEHWAFFARTLDMHATSAFSQGYQLSRVSERMIGAGQELMNPPGVEGWGEQEAWLQDQWVLSRANAMGRLMDFGPDRTADLPYHLLPPQSTWDEPEVRREMILALASAFHLPLTEEEISVYMDVLDDNGIKAFYLYDDYAQQLLVKELVRLMAMDIRVITQ